MNQAQYQNRTRQIVVTPRSTAIAYLIFILTGFSGLHWFYFRRPGLAIAKFLTVNFFVIGMIIDAIMIPKNVRQANGHP